MQEGFSSNCRDLLTEFDETEAPRDFSSVKQESVFLVQRYRNVQTLCVGLDNVPPAMEV